MARNVYRLAVSVDLYLSIAATSEDEARSTLTSLLPEEGVTWDDGPFAGHLPAIYTQADNSRSVSLEDIESLED